MISEYIALEALAARLNLPQEYIKELAQNGDIPYLYVNGRMRFCEPDVRQALTNLSNKLKQSKGAKKCSN